jgi:group I intron endonuclease
MNILDCGIYEIRHIVSGKRYVGSSYHISKRIKEHQKMLEKGEHHSPHLQHAYNAYGIDSFEFNVLAYLEEKELKSTEQRLIALNFSLDDNPYNTSKDASSPMRGRRHSQKTKALMSKQRMGNENWKFRTTSSKGKKMSPEFCEKQRQLKQDISKETRLKMSLAKINFIPHNKGKHQMTCKRGHPKTEENCYVNRGSWWCRICMKIREDRFKNKEKK